MKKTNSECLNKMDLDLIHLIKNGVFYCARKNSADKTTTKKAINEKINELLLAGFVEVVAHG